MENLIVALKTVVLFLNTLGYETDINFDFFVWQNFRNHKQDFTIYDALKNNIGNISFYDYNNKILITLNNENKKNNLMGRFDVALETPHTLRGYLSFLNKYRLSLEMALNFPMMDNPGICFKGEYFFDKEHMTFTIGDNSDFWLTKTWQDNKEIISLNWQHNASNNLLLKHIVAKGEKYVLMHGEKVYKELNKKIQIVKVSSEEKPYFFTYNNLDDLLLKLKQNISFNYQKSIIDFNNKLNGLLARFLTLALPNFSANEFCFLFGFHKDTNQLEENIKEFYARDKQLLRTKN